MKKNQSILLSLLLLSINFLMAQGEKKHRGVPNDLNTSKIIFLRHDSIEEPAERPKTREGKIEYVYKRNHNTKVPEANIELELAVKKYPFEYIIAHRDEIDKYKAQGYKYVLDFEPFITLREGHPDISGHYNFKYPVYIKDLTNDDFYVLDEVDQYFAYQYKNIIEKSLMKEVRKKFKSK